METLRLGSKGPLVKRWETFLLGLGLFGGEVDEEFDADTEEATRRFQTMFRLGIDGEAGNQTIGRAMVQGFSVIDDPSDAKHTPNWPPPPTDLQPVNLATRLALFGEFHFKPAPTPDNPEGILILDDWQRDNIAMVEVPQLKTVKYTPGNQKIAWNAKARDQLVALFAAWEQAGLMPLVLTWAGSWNPRFVRGSRTYLSNHAWGTAFDINVPWNGLGVRPALVGSTGSVRELVALANEHGFYWGGHFKDRPDGMHFEVAKIT